MWWLPMFAFGGTRDADVDGYSVAAGDCDDEDATLVPGADETCDGRDEDCNGQIDDAPVDGATYHVDDDRDGYGDDERSLVACAAPDGYAAVGGDCDDSDDASGWGDDIQPCGFSIAVDWTRAGATITITEGVADRWGFGIAETGVEGPAWLGEDCLEGSASGFGVDVCHTLDREGGELVWAEPDDVADGRTLFTAEVAVNVTYLLFDRASPEHCWVWGEGPSYYDALDCRPMP